MFHSCTYLHITSIGGVVLPSPVCLRDSRTCRPIGVLQAEALKEENDSLRCQLDAYRNEVELLKQEQGKNQPIRSEEDSTHTQQLSFLQQALQGMQKVATFSRLTHTGSDSLSDTLILFLPPTQ